MIDYFLELFAHWIIVFIETTHYYGIFITMALESANVPIPSEIVMPFAGFLSFENQLSFWLIVLVGTLANLVGSLTSYSIGYWGGARFVKKYGRYIFFTEEDLLKGESLFRRHGAKIAFFSRMLPVVRTFVSLPAGALKADVKKFSIYTFLGSLPWNFVLVYIGFILGKEWQKIHIYFRQFDIVIVLLLAVGIVWYIWKKVNYQR